MRGTDGMAGNKCPFDLILCLVLGRPCGHNGTRGKPVEVDARTFRIRWAPGVGGGPGTWMNLAL